METPLGPLTTCCYLNLMICWSLYVKIIYQILQSMFYSVGSPLINENLVLAYELPQILGSLCGRKMLHTFDTLSLSAFQKCMMGGLDQ